MGHRAPDTDELLATQFVGPEPSRLLCVAHSARASLPNTCIKPDGAEAEAVDRDGGARPRHHCSWSSAVALPTDSVCVKTIQETHQ